MRVLAGIALLVSMVPAMAGAELVYFSQDFSSSSTVADYTSATPGTNKFNSINTGAGDAFSISGGALQLTKGAAIPSTINRSTALAAAPLTLFKFQFDIGFAFTGQTAGKSLGFFELYNNSPTTVWGSFGFQVNADAADNTWRVTGGTGGFTGMKTVKVFVNDTGSNATYIDPLGAQRTITNSFVEVWVGNTLAKSSAQTGLANDINGFRYVSAATGITNGTLTFDNFLIEEVMPPLFSQDFSSSTNVADYRTPAGGTNKFNAISAGAGDAFSITNGALKLTKGAAVASVIGRTTALAASPLTLFRFQFDIGFAFIASNQAANASLGFFELGNGAGNVVWGSFGFQLDSNYKDNMWRVTGVKPAWL